MVSSSARLKPLNCNSPGPVTVEALRPARVVARLMGLEEYFSDDFVTWSDDIAAFLGHPAPDLALGQRAQRSALALAGVFQRVLVRRRRAEKTPTSTADWTGLLLEAERQGQVQSTEELLAQCVMLLFAGHETTRHLLANGLLLLLEHPQAWQSLCRDPALLPGAVRELLRYDSPVQYTGRRVVTDLELHGQGLRRGDLVVALIGAANRDPARHERPDELDITRRSGAPLAFGQGPHACIGAALTLMEAQTAFAQVIKRWPDLQLVSPRTAAWTGSPLYRGLTALPVQRAEVRQVA